MKNTRLSPYLLMALMMSPLVAEEPSDEAAQVREEAQAALEAKVSGQLKKAESLLRSGEIEGVDQLLAEALALDPENARAKELRKLCEDMTTKLERLEDRQRDRRNFRADPLDVVRANEKIGGRLAEAQRRQLTSRLERALTPAIAEALLRKVSLKDATSGQAALDSLRKSTGLNMVVDASVKGSEAFQSSPDLELADVKAVSCLNHLARIWGAQWDIEDEAIVFSRPMDREEADIVPEGYKPEDCEKLELGGMGIGGEPDAGIMPDGTLRLPVSQLRVAVPGSTPKVLVDADGNIQLLVDPETVSPDAKKKP
ncbi:MAG: hypothetical protein AB7F75_09025 [Planctomycetota bacterium]